MTNALNRCPVAHDGAGDTVGSGNAGSSSCFFDGTMIWHGDRTDVKIARPGWTAANEALVSPFAVTGFWTVPSAVPLTTSGSHGLESVPRNST
ncbi:MAG TPA: hypothetical protein VF070_12195 [Streptosporangiaceae bacterium]